MRVVILGIAMMVSASVWAQSTSSKAAEFTLNPEYEAIIAEAKKLGKEPVDLALEKKKSEDWASLLDSYIIKKAAKEGEAENAKKLAYIDQLRKESAKILADIDQLRKESAKLKAETAANKQETAKLVAQDIESYRKIISIIDGLKKQGKFNQHDIEVINDIYNDKITPPDLKTEIEQKYKQYLKPAAK